MTEQQIRDFEERIRNMSAPVRTGIAEIDDQLVGIIPRLQIYRVSSFDCGQDKVGNAWLNTFPEKFSASFRIVENTGISVPHSEFSESVQGLSMSGVKPGRKREIRRHTSLSAYSGAEWPESDHGYPEYIADAIIRGCEHWLKKSAKAANMVVMVNCIAFYRTQTFPSDWYSEDELKKVRLHQEDQYHAIRRALGRLNIYAAEKQMPIIVATNLESGPLERSFGYYK